MKLTLNDIYYNSITNMRCFKNLTLDKESQFYYENVIQTWEDKRNKNLLKKPLKNFTKGWLIPFNRHLARIMNRTIYLTELAVKRKENKIDKPLNNICLLVDRDLYFLKNLPEAIRLNYDNDKYLAFEMKEYFSNGLNLMHHFIERRCYVDIKQTPIFYEINKSSEEIENSIDIEKVKLFVENKKVNKPQQNNTNPHPQIFIETKTYHHFSIYTKRYIIDNYSDYSYLFQRMKKEKLIHYIKHLDFMEWLNKNEFISEKTLSEFKIKNNFKSLEKSYSAQRENNFNNVFNL